MNPDDPHQPWRRLAAAARNARDERDATVPHGFATRVAARAFSSSGRGTSLLERFAFRAVGMAALLAVLSVAVNYPALNATDPSRETAEELFLPVEDAVAVALDFGE